MLAGIRTRLTCANVIALVALFIAASPASGEIDAGDLDTAATVTADFHAGATDGGQVAGGYVSCPAGYKVFTGGAFWWRNSPDEFLIGDSTLTLNGSTPTFDGNGWYADGLNFNDAVDANLRVIARCLPEGRLDKVKLRKKTVGVSAAGPVDRRVACPDGTRIISGGAFWHNPGAAPDWTGAFDRLASSGPTSARAWYAAGAPQVGPRRLTVVARCLASGRLSAYKRLDDRTTLQSGAPWSVTAGCGGGRRVGPTGVYFHKPGKPPKPALGDDSRLSAVGAWIDPNVYMDAGAVVGPAELIRESVAFCLAP